MRSQQPVAPSGGFTLVELLVVIAIIAVLTAILLPTLAWAKAKARSVECLSRQKHWAQAFRTYVDEDGDGKIPREGYERTGEVVLNNWTQVSGRPLPNGGRETDDVWYNALPKKIGLPPTYFYSSPSRRGGFYERNNPIQCPSARFPAQVHRSIYQFALFSIAMNSHLIRAGEGPTINYTSIDNYKPTETVLFLDNLLEGEEVVHPDQDLTNLGQPAAFADRFSPRHLKGGNLAFADGHAAPFQGPKVVETNPDSELRGGPIVPEKGIIWELPYPRRTATP